jgi:hypothetical protein
MMLDRCIQVALVPPDGVPLLLDVMYCNGGYQPCLALIQRVSLPAQLDISVFELDDTLLSPTTNAL